MSEDEELCSRQLIHLKTLKHENSLNVYSLTLILFHHSH